MSEPQTHSPQHLLEALFELRFLHGAGPVTDEQKAYVASQLRARLPRQAQGVDRAINVDVQAHGGQLQTRLRPPGTRHIFRAPSGTPMVQLTDACLSVHVLRPHAGWPVLEALAVDIWTLCQQVLGVRAAAQLVLRFVNRFERSEAAPRVGDWLATGTFLPAGILEAEAGFLVKTQLQSDSEVTTAAVTAGTLAVGEHERSVGLPLLLDLEITRDLALALPTQSFSEMLAAMHLRAREAFLLSLGPAARRQLA